MNAECLLGEKGALAGCSARDYAARLAVLEAPCDRSEEQGQEGAGGSGYQRRCP